MSDPGRNREELRSRALAAASAYLEHASLSGPQTLEIALYWEPWWIAPASALLSIGVGTALYRFVDRQEGGSAAVEMIAETIRRGARTFIRREYRALALFVGSAALCLVLFAPSPLWTSQARPLQNLQLALAYLLGSSGSALAGVLGLHVATRANAKTAQAAQRGLAAAFPVSFRGGAVMGLAVVGLGLLGVSLIYASTGDVHTLVGYGFGASSIALFAKVGGGIFTKSADIAADLVGKVELGLAEDDPRNPAVIADNVGDNVGDVAGMGADLFDSYVAAVVAVMVLGSALDAGAHGAGTHVQIPLVFAGLGIIAAVLGILSVQLPRSAAPGAALMRGTRLACALFAVFTAAATLALGYSWRVWGAASAGWLAGLVIGSTTDHFTSEHSRAVEATAAASQTGAALNLITGFAYGLRSVLPSLLGIGAAAAISYKLCEPLGGLPFAVFGIAMAALGMLATVGFTVAADAYGPIVDNARGIAEQAQLGARAVAVADELDAAGNSAKAITKGFAIGAAGLTVIALLAAFQTIAEQALREQSPIAAGPSRVDFSLLNPLVLFGLMAGLAVPAVFSARLMLGVSRNARRMIDEVRRQFRETPGLREAKAGVRPDYERCIDIATRGALEELRPACLAAILFTVLVGFLGGVEAMGGYLAGAILSSLLLSLLMANAGGLWDNAKKLIESGRYGGRDSDAHRAAVVGDTVGDPFKDTAGPSLNTLITVMSLIGMLLAGSMVRYNLVGWLGL